MYRDRLPQKQTGAGLPIALFIITALSLMVLGMSQLQESSGNAISLQIQSQRAFFAAESGAQIAVTKLMAGESCPGSPVSFPGKGLSDCTADIQCTGSDIDEVVSTGRCGSGQEGASRTVEVRLR